LEGALMPYRNGTYIAFHAEGTTDPTVSDIKYFNIMKAWHEHDDIDFRFVNSHDKVSSVRDTRKLITLFASFRERLSNSKNFILIVGNRTRFDTDCVPYEIRYAIDTCGLPIICTYPGQGPVLDCAPLRTLLPQALRERIASNTARTVHVPFDRNLIDKAIRQFDVNNLPEWTETVFTVQTYRKHGYSV
jgi:hypothetical protein